MTFSYSSSSRLPKGGPAVFSSSSAKFGADTVLSEWVSSAIATNGGDVSSSPSFLTKRPSRARGRQPVNVIGVIAVFIFLTSTPFHQSGWGGGILPLFPFVRASAPLGSGTTTAHPSTGGTTTTTTTTTPSSIPRSTNSRHAASQRSLDSNSAYDGSGDSPSADEYIPPWNPSKKIDGEGFLSDIYRCVPGEWESDCSVGGRYSDLRKKSRFLFGVHRRNRYFYENYGENGSAKNGVGGDNRAMSIRPGGTDRAAAKKQRNTDTENSSNPRMMRGGANAVKRFIGPDPRLPKHDLVDRKSQYLTCRVRQVPGDGNCLFHSVAACLSVVVNGTHSDMKNTTELCRMSSHLRREAVECLGGTKRGGRRRVLFLQGRECLRAEELVEAAAAQYNMSAEEYCHFMGQECYWGGGPEIVALCNVLRRPIHVYELSTGDPLRPPPTSPVSAFGRRRRHENDDDRDPLSNTKEFCLRRMACFGSPKFDRREPLHILSADSRFPDISPGKQLSSGNHFLALFPYSSTSGEPSSP